jgi:hypothetical protein
MQILNNTTSTVWMRAVHWKNDPKLINWYYWTTSPSVHNTYWQIFIYTKPPHNLQHTDSAAQHIFSHGLFYGSTTSRQQSSISSNIWTPPLAHREYNPLSSSLYHHLLILPTTRLMSIGSCPCTVTKGSVQRDQQVLTWPAQQGSVKEGEGWVIERFIYFGV